MGTRGKDVGKIGKKRKAKRQAQEQNNEKKKKQGNKGNIELESVGKVCRKEK
jgi:hypothetical protein